MRIRTILFFVLRSILNSCRSKDRLLYGLTEAQRADFMQYESGNAQLSLISELEAFKQGFRLGARLIIDALSVDCDEALSE